MKNCVILGAARTAVGGYLGSLKTVEAQELGAAVIKESCKRAGIGLDVPEQIILGDVYGYTPNVSRCAALVAGVPIETPAYVVDRQCASSLQALYSAVTEIRAEEADIVVAGGVETMSRMTFYLDPETRYSPLRMGDKPLYDTFFHGVTMVSSMAYPGLNMGLTAENVAEKYGITREAQDEFALDSQMKMKAAKEAGKFKDEIVPFEVQSRKGSVVFEEDEHNTPDTTLESLAKLKPAFKRKGWANPAGGFFETDGTVTAGNASGMNDGASAVVVASEEKAKELGAKPLVKVLTVTSTGCDPRIMGIGPVSAIGKALQKTGLKLEDIDLFELNEAFAAQALGCLTELGMLPGTELYKRVNVNGGAIAHGHALANSGTRLLTTLIYEMKRRNSRYGVVSLCIGGGQGMACIVENIE